MSYLPELIDWMGVTKKYKLLQYIILANVRKISLMGDTKNTVKALNPSCQNCQIWSLEWELLKSTNYDKASVLLTKSIEWELLKDSNCNNVLFLFTK